MNSNEFIEKFAEALEIEDASALTAETEFRSLDEWDSLLPECHRAPRRRVRHSD